MLRPLAANLGGRPFYALGFSGSGPPPRTIEEHARNEAATMLRVYPQGPYLVGGWCASGVLAFEIARQLTAQGKKVALVVLLDAPNYASRRHASIATRVRCRMAAAWEGARHAGSQLLARPPAAWPRSVAAPFEPAQLFVAAARRYVPGTYAGKVLLVRRSERVREWAGGPDFGWRGVAADLEVLRAEGDHVSVFAEPNVFGLAAALRERFDSAGPATKAED